MTELFKPRHFVPETTSLTGTVIDGFRVITASDLGMARASVTHARATGSVGDETYVYAVAEWDVPLQNRAIEKWAIVERVSK